MKNITKVISGRDTVKALDVNLRVEEGKSMPWWKMAQKSTLLMNVLSAVFIPMEATRGYHL